MTSKAKPKAKQLKSKAESPVEEQRSVFTPELNKLRDEERKKRISPPRSLPGVSGLLDDRRIKYSIPDDVFRVAAVYDRILVYQVLEDDGEVWSDGGIIIKTKSHRGAERRTTPTGVIITAGCEALDILRSNGMDLGHLVFYTQLAFYRIPLHSILGEDVNLVVLRAGEIVASVDLSYALQSRQTRIVPKEREIDGVGTRIEHILVDGEGKAWNPVLGFSPDDL